MGVELDYSDKDIIVENVHLGDSLMIMNCRICRNMTGESNSSDADIGDELVENEGGKTEDSANEGREY